MHAHHMRDGEKWAGESGSQHITQTQTIRRILTPSPHTEIQKHLQSCLFVFWFVLPVEVEEELIRRAAVMFGTRLCRYVRFLFLGAL